MGVHYIIINLCQDWSVNVCSHYTIINLCQDWSVNVCSQYTVIICARTGLLMYVHSTYKHHFVPGLVNHCMLTIHNHHFVPGLVCNMCSHYAIINLC